MLGGVSHIYYKSKSGENDMAPIAAFNQFGALFDDSAIRKLLETQQLIEKSFSSDALNSLLGAQQAMSSLVNSASFQSIQGLNMSAMSSSLIEFTQQTRKISALVSPAWEQMHQQTSWLNSILPNIDSSLRDFFAYSYPELTQTAKRATLSDVLGKLDELNIPECKDDDISRLSDDDKSELERDLAEISDDPADWQQKIMSKAIAYKAKNPVLAWVFICIILPIIINIAVALIPAGIGTLLKAASVKESPSADSEIICQVKQDQIVEIVGDEPYYYLIEFEDPNTNEVYQGYVSKRSIRPVEDIEPLEDK